MSNTTKSKTPCDRYTVSYEVADYDLFRRCLDKDSLIYYDKKMEEHKNRSYKDLIEKNHIMIKFRRYKYNHGREAMIQRKRFKVKTIDYLPMIKDINPIKEVSFHSHVFQLDSSVQSSDYYNDVDISEKLFDLKRCQELVYDSKSLLYTYSIKLEDRCQSENSNRKSIANFKYYKSWLASLGDSRANDLEKVLERVVIGRDRSDNQKNKIFDNINSKRIPRKIPVMRLSNETKDYLSTVPHVCRYSVMDLETNRGFLREVKLSKKYCDQIGGELTMNSCKFGKDYDEIDLLTAWRTPNWIKMHTHAVFDICRLDKYDYNTDICKIQPKDLVYIRNRSGKIIPGTIKLFIESFIENDNMCFQTYFALDQS